MTSRGFRATMNFTDDASGGCVRPARGLIGDPMCDYIDLSPVRPDPAPSANPQAPTVPPKPAAGDLPPAIPPAELLDLGGVSSDLELN